MTEKDYAMEMARRKVQFHNTKQWDEIELWGLFKYNKTLQKMFDENKLINHLNYKPENIMYWVIPTKEYWETVIKPIIDTHTIEELTSHFYQ